MLSFAAICPHPPLIIPSIGGEETNKVKKTVKAMETLGQDLAAAGVETVIIVSPHGSVEWDKMNINVSENLYGNFFKFRDQITKMNLKNDLEMAQNIVQAAQNSEIPIGQVQGFSLDHGTMVPLYFLIKDRPEIKVVPITYSFMDYRAHFNFGKAIYRVIAKTGKKIAFIASGDLSHRLSPDAPAGYSPRGREFDKLLVELLKAGQAEEILNLDSKLIEEAGECGLRSFAILLGVLASSKYKFEKISYEGPFGVGYLVGKYDLISCGLHSY